MPGPYGAVPPRGNVREAELLAQLNAQGAELAAYQQACYAYAEPLVRQVIYALDTMADVARNPRHPGQLNALKLLGAWAKVCERAREAGGGIKVAEAMPPGPNGGD